MLSGLLSALANGFGLGVSLLFAIGAQSAFVLRQGLRRQNIFAVTTICATCDIFLITLGASGFALVVASVGGLSSAVAWAAVAFLTLYGGRSIYFAASRRAFQGQDGDVPKDMSAVVGTTLAVTLLNPHVYLDTIFLLGGLAALYSGDERIAFTAGAIAASFVWFYGLGYGASQLASLFTQPLTWRIVDGCTGALMWAIAGGLAFEQIRL